MLVCN